MRFCFRGIVAHMQERPASPAPMRQWTRDILFGLVIVARAPVGMIDSALQVDQQQNGAIGRGEAYVVAGLSGANRAAADAAAAGCGAGRCGASLVSLG